MAQPGSKTLARTPANATAGGMVSTRVVAATPARHWPAGKMANAAARWPALLQAKLTVGHPNDIHEQEADRIAEEVVRLPDPAPAWSSIDPAPIRPLSLQRRCGGVRRGSVDARDAGPSRRNFKRCHRHRRCHLAPGGPPS